MVKFARGGPTWLDHSGDPEKEALMRKIRSPARITGPNSGREPEAVLRLRRLYFPMCGLSIVLRKRL